MKKEETLLLKLQGDNKSLKAILKESADLLNTFTKSIHKINEEVNLTGKSLTPATEAFKKFLGVADSKAINIKIDHTKVDTVIKKFEVMLNLLSNIQTNSRISFDISGVEGLDKASKAMKSLVNSLHSSSLKKVDVGGINLSKDPNSTKNIQSPEIKIKGLEKLDIYNKALSEMIKKLENLKQLGKEINIDLKGLETLTKLLNEFEKLEAKTKKLQEEIDKLKKSMEHPVANFVEPAKKGIDDTLPKMSMWLVALDLMASAAKVALREIGQAFIDLSDDILKFEQQVYQARTVLQDGLGDFQKTASTIVDSAREIGASANKAAGGIKTVFAAGINEVKDALYGYQIAQMSAMATQSDMNDLINFGVLANKNYSATVQDWPTLFNKISVAATQSKLDIADFAKQGGTIASGFTAANISLDESLALVSSFGNYLRNASEATVAATNMVKKIIQPTQEMKRVLKEVNSETEGIGQKLIFSPSGLKGIDGTLEGFLRNFNTKVEAYAKKNASTVQDVLARMFKEIRANRGLQVAYASIMSGEFDRIKKEVQNDTTFLKRAFEESTKSILNRWEILTNNISSDFKKIFIAIQPSLHQFLDFVEESINQVIEFFRELGAEFSWLADSQIWEDTKNMFSGLGTVIKFLLTVIGDLIKLLASGLNAVLKFIEGVQTLFSDLRNFIGTFWSDLTQNGIKNIFTYFDSQISAFKQKSDEFFDQVWKFFTNIGKVGKGDYFDDKEANSSISSKVDKNMPVGKKKNFDPYQALAEYGNRGVEMIETAKEIGDDMLTVEDEINRIRLSEMEYATKEIIKKHEERTDKIKQALEDERGMLDSLQKSFDKVREKGTPTDPGELKKYTTLAGALANQKRKLKDIETQANQDIIKANELRDLQLEQLRKKREEEEKSDGEKRKNDEIERIKDGYQTNLKRYEDDKNKLIEAETEKGTSKEEIALKTNKFLTQIQNLQSETAKKLLKYDLKEYQDFKEKSSETSKNIQTNITNFEKQSLDDRLKIKQKAFSEENEELNFNAEFYKVSEEHKLTRQKEINEARLIDINNFLTKDKELQKAKYKETREALLIEQKNLLNQNKLSSQKIKELQIKKEMELEKNALNQKKSIIDFEEQYRLDSAKNLINKRRALVQKEIAFAKKELANIPDSDWQSKGNKRAEIFAMEKFVLPGIDNTEIQLARQLENQRHQDKIDNLNRESELNKINTYQALDLEKQVNTERLATLEYRLSKEVNEEEKSNITREKNALEHANRLIDIAKTNEMLNDFSKINTAFSNISKTFLQSSSTMGQMIGNLSEPISELGDKFLDISKKVASSDIVGLAIMGAEEGVKSLSSLIDSYDKLNKVLNSTEKSLQDINEAALENIKAVPFFGEAIYRVSRTVTDLIGKTLPESVKKARKEIQELLKQIGKYENEKNIISTEQRIKFIEKERDQQLKTIDLVSEGGAEFLAKYMKTWNDYFEKIANLQKEINQAEKDSTWENTLAKIASQEDTFDNKMSLIDLEEKREIEKARENYKSEKQLLLDINTIELKAEKQRNNLRKEESEKEKEETEKLSETRTEMYEKELDMIDKIYGKHKEKLSDEIDQFNQKIKDLNKQIKDIEKDFYDNRNKESEKTSKRYSIFSQALSSRKSELSPSFFRSNQKEMDIQSSLSSSQAQTEFEQTGNFEAYQARMAKVALDKFAYMQKRLSDTVDPEERAEIEEKLLSIRQEYYNYAFDKEKEAMEEKKLQLETEKREAEDNLKKKQDEITTVKNAEIKAIEEVNSSYEQSGNFWLDTMTNRTDTWMNYAKNQAKDLFSESKDEVGKLFQEFEKIKAKVVSEISGKNTSTGSVGGGGSFNQINTNAPGNNSGSIGAKIGGLVSGSTQSSSSAPFAVGLNAMLGQINNSSSNPAPGSSNVIDPDIQKANVIRDIARNNPGFSEQYFFDKYFSFPLETIRDVARQQMIKGYYKNGTPFVPSDGAYYLHQGERVLTEKENRNYSTASTNLIFYNNITGVKLDNAQDIKNAVNELQNSMTTQLQQEFYRR